MGAPVRIDDGAFGDDRFDDLAAAAGLADADHARGKMARLWRQCTIEQTYALPKTTITRVLGENGANALVIARLGEVEGDLVRLRGTRGRIEWLKKLRGNAKFGKRGGRPKKNPQGFQEKPTRVSGNATSETPLTLTLTPTLTLTDQKEEMSGKPDGLREPNSERLPDRASQIAELAVQEINRISGRRFDPKTSTTVKDCKAIARDKRTDVDVLLVIRSKAGWLQDPQWRDRFCPSTILRPGNFPRYLDEARAQQPVLRVLPGQSEDQPVTGYGATEL